MVALLWTCNAEVPTINVSEIVMTPGSRCVQRPLAEGTLTGVRMSYKFLGANVGNHTTYHVDVGLQGD